MLGAFKLNGLSRYVAAGGGGGVARASDAVYSVLAGSPGISGAGGKFGGRIIIDSNAPTFEAARLTVDPSDTGWYFNTDQEWTVEGWVYKNSTFESSHLVRWLSVGQTLSSGFTTSINDGPHIGISFSTSYSSGWAFMTVNSTNRSPLFSVENNWKHFAFVCHGNNTISTYNNGALGHNAVALTYNPNSRFMDIGMGSPDSNYEVWFDNIRISNNQRYASAFTAPTAAFTNDANTLGLFHFDGNSTDDSA